jgi:hypothetical protein
MESIESAILSQDPSKYATCLLHNVENHALETFRTNPPSFLSCYSTCFNRIDLPNYSTRKELYEKLKAAITLSAVGFDME